MHPLFSKNQPSGASPRQPDCHPFDLSGFSAAVRLARRSCAAASRGRPAKASTLRAARRWRRAARPCAGAASSAAAKCARRRPRAGRGRRRSRIGRAGPPGLDVRAVVLDARARRRVRQAPAVVVPVHAARRHFVSALGGFVRRPELGVADEVVARLSWERAAAVAAAVAAANPVGRASRRTRRRPPGWRRGRGASSRSSTGRTTASCTRWSARLGVGSKSGAAAGPEFWRERGGAGEGEGGVGAGIYR